ncbi:MAG: hypothetical protein Q9227_007407 [Pyrenula ochraceoflavens]
MLRQVLTLELVRITVWVALLALVTAADEVPLVGRRQGWRKGDLVPVTCLNRTIDTGEHIQDPTGSLQWIPFPTCNETFLPLALPFNTPSSLSCTIDSLSDELYHLLEFYTHDDVPFECRIPSVPLPSSSSTLNDDRDSSEAAQWTPMTISLQGTLQLSHLHIHTSVNTLIHTGPVASASGSKAPASDALSIIASTAYSVPNMTSPDSLMGSKVIRLEPLTFTFNIGWIEGRPDWADDFETDDPTALPPPVTTTAKDGTKTTIFYRLNDDGARVRVTRKTRTTLKQERVNPAVAERRAWAKFGAEKGKSAGPQSDTTSIAENIVFRPSVNWKSEAKESEKNGTSGAGQEKSMKEQLRDKKVKCRICGQEHFTASKDTLAPVGEAGAIGTPGGDAMAEGDDARPTGGALGGGGSSYVPPHLRKGGAATGERMGGGKYERDDLATLRVTNVSELAEEAELRDMFERFGRVTRVFLAKDRDSGRAKGFAFISFADRSDAAKACAKLDGFGYRHLILRVEFAKKPDK